jgi:acetyl-CoA carboxylase, biotin carboxylase subunit
MGDKIEAKRTAKELGHSGGAGLGGRGLEIDRGQSARRRHRLSGHHQGGVRRRRARHEGGPQRGRSRGSRCSTAQAEAKAAFGDGDVYIEKYLEKPRHIEIQVLGDGKGRAVHLGERDCSLQRRHQKIWEEAHSPALNEAQRDEIGERVAQGHGQARLSGVGTVEFLYENGEFFFIEMNTRLQVEHPVTEMITGLDLVQEQIRVASGMPPAAPGRHRVLRPCHRMPHQCGEPDHLRALARPGGGGARAGRARRPDRFRHLYAGYRIPPYYDSLIGKLIVFGKTRTECLMRLKRALGEFVIEGIETTIPLFLSLLQSPTSSTATTTSTGLNSTWQEPRLPPETSS